jgi:hypothetical protein
MASVKSVLNCIGRDTSGSVSVLGDLFGFVRRRVPNDTGSGTFSVSMLDTVRGMQGRHVHLNVIAVGWWNEFSDSTVDIARRKTDFAIMRTRQIFAARNLGVGRVVYGVIDRDESDGTDIIGSEGEADDLSDDWSVNNNGVDCFIPRSISDSDFIGLSPVDGDCSKGGKRDGLIAGAINRGGGVNSGFNGFARTFAHEVGHYLSLPHNHGSSCPSGTAANNLMAQTRCITLSAAAAVTLTSSQGSDMRGHCTTRSGC